MPKFTPREGFQEAFETYVKVVQEVYDSYFKQNLPNLTLINVLVEPKGRRYKKVVTDNGVQRMVHSFVEIETGYIFKPASWKAPAKHARGSIFVNEGRDALTPQGSVHYLR
jgi:hypothetical protein